jgi:tripartite-type tricarboxylate transporter receptor subunit TctC
VSIPQDAIVVRTESPWNSLADMVADAKATKKPISIASQVSLVNLMADVIAAKEGIEFKVVPVKGGSKGIAQVLGGHVDVTWSGSGWHKQVQAGTMKALASIGTKRNPDYPDLPTLIELGYDYTFTDTFMLSAPKGVPADVLDKLSAAVKQVLTPEFDQQLRSKMKLSVEYRGPAETNKFLHGQHDFIKPLVDKMKQ